VRVSDKQAQGMRFISPALLSLVASCVVRESETIISTQRRI